MLRVRHLARRRRVHSRFDFAFEVTRGEQVAAKCCSGASPSCYLGLRGARRHRREEAGRGGLLLLWLGETGAACKAHHHRNLRRLGLSLEGTRAIVISWVRKCP
jgi:hypothetical protein